MENEQQLDLKYMAGQNLDDLNSNELLLVCRNSGTFDTKRIAAQFGSSDHDDVVVSAAPQLFMTPVNPVKKSQSLHKIRLGSNYQKDLKEGQTYTEAVFKRLNFHHFQLSEEVENRLKVTACYISKLIELLQQEGVTITITSGYRTPEFNATLKGASPTSHHLRGAACDMVPKGCTSTQLYRFIENYISKQLLPDGELIVYNKFIHYAPAVSHNRQDFRGRKDKN